MTKQDDELKKHFEQNMLDGDKVQAGQMLSSGSVLEYLQDVVRSRERVAEKRGMEKAKSRVLRRTEIPKDAREPTRDAVVILGEEIADIITRDIAELEKEQDDG